MDNASLPYLKQIAEALKKYSGANGSSTSISGITVSGGGSDSGEVAKSLETGLFAETEGEQWTVSKSAIELLKDELVKILHDAMYVTVTEGRLPVEKSAFAIMTEKLAVLATLHISDIIRHLSLTQEGGEDTELVADITMRSEGDLIADGNVIAGTAGGPAEIGNVLYRLDSWGNYIPAPAADNTEDWVPSAKIVKDKLDELEAAIDDIDDTELRQQIFTLQQQNAALTTRVQALEARKQFEFVLPGETWPPTTMEENMLYIKLNQVS